MFSSQNYIINSDYIFSNTLYSTSYIKDTLLDDSINLLAEIKPSVRNIYRTSALQAYLNSINHSYLKSEPQPYSIHNFFSFVDRTIILGKAGAGKSSLTKYITLTLLKKSINVFNNDDSLDYIPFRIQLFQYNQEKKLNGDSLHTYLLKYLQNELAIKNISILLLNHLLEKVNCLIFFDGLDEIFDIQDRLNVRDDIEVFAKNHSKCKIAVTSRFESNTEVPFDVDTFSVYEVEGFNNDQVDNYIERWYSVVEKEEIYKAEEINKFKTELKKIDVELIENPLLLSLILIIYKNERELPTSKFDIYKGCTNTIVETRDKKEKRINYSTAVLNKIGVFSSLAYWQFSQENRDKKAILNNDVIKFLTTELHSDFGDIDIAEQAAKEFIEFAKIRSIYFENSFTHKTFSEYFTSHYIYTEYFLINDNRHLLDERLNKYIGSASWSVIFELLFCEIDAQVGNSKIIDLYVNNLTSQGNIKAINFFLQIIKYLRNISLNAISQLLNKAYRYCFDEVNLKENIIECRICFESLCSLKANARFNKLCIDSYESLTLNIFDDIEKYNARIFLYEQHLYNAEIYTPLNNNIDNDLMNPYELILINYSTLSNWDNFFTTLEIFIKKFGIKEACKNYESIYFKDLFKDDKKYNWVTKALFSHGDIHIIGKNYRKIRSLNFAKHHLVDILNRSTSNNKFEYNEIMRYEKLVKDDTLKKLLKYYLQKYFPDVKEFRNRVTTKSNRKFK